MKSVSLGELLEPRLVSPPHRQRRVLHESTLLGQPVESRPGSPIRGQRQVRILLELESRLGSPIHQQRRIRMNPPHPT